jgi:hypothetical protein
MKTDLFAERNEAWLDLMLLVCLAMKRKLLVTSVRVYERFIPALHVDEQQI